MTLETTQDPPQPKRVHKSVLPSDSDVEMEAYEDQEPTPRPKNRFGTTRAIKESTAEDEDEGECEDEGEDEGEDDFQTPQTLKQKKTSATVVMMSFSDLSDLSGDGEESEWEGSVKEREVLGVKGKGKDKV